MTLRTSDMAGPRSSRTRRGPRPVGAPTTPVSPLPAYPVRGRRGRGRSSRARQRRTSDHGRYGHPRFGHHRGLPAGPKAWGEFDAIYRPMLFAFLLKQGLREDEADDVVQDIFEKLLGKIHTYEREKSKFRTWLFSVAHHTLIDRARRRASYRKAVDGWVANILRRRTRIT